MQKHDTQNTSEFHQVSQNRAKAIKRLLNTKTKLKEPSAEEMKLQGTTIPWSDNINSEESAAEYFQQKFPQLPSVAAKAYANYITRAVNGQIALPEYLLATKHNQHETKWDPIADLEKERITGMMNNTFTRLEKLKLQ